MTETHPSNSDRPQKSQDKNTTELMKTLILTLAMTAATLCPATAIAQTEDSEAKLKVKIEEYLQNYRPRGYDNGGIAPQMLSYSIDDMERTLTVNTNETLATMNLNPSAVKSLYKHLSKSLPRPFNKYSLHVISCGLPIEQLYIGASGPCKGIRRGQWGNIDYTGKPWVQNISSPNKTTLGLFNRHISLWASHGTYYDANKQIWKWQRPILFGTTEDLFTQTIVVPYLIPMLENSGAVVYTPRERDWQTNEVIVDNDTPGHYYQENDSKDWRTAPLRGFATRHGVYHDGENPFMAGSARMTVTAKNKSTSEASYQPNIPEAGKYAVYVSYQTVEGSTDNAHYTVYHKGQATEFSVNQQMGGSTWVYLGTFDFDKGCNTYNRVVVSNKSTRKGAIVTTDAIRFGGGMGNTERGGITSGMPRCLEAARYNVQWSGAPYNVYSTRKGTDDYADDINSRSLATNWLAGGSTYMPTIDGNRVPIELSLAIHSDAGYDSFGNGIIGSLAVCTTDFNDGLLNSGASRMMSLDFAKALLNNTDKDIRAKYRQWAKRYLWDRNYSETRCPEVPSAILETLSHQNFPDMLMGQDPNFKFTLARSIYKTILRFVNTQHTRPCVVQPLPPSNFRIDRREDGTIDLAWTPTIDLQEPTAMPTAYNLYMAEGTGGFDNGREVSATHYTFRPEPGVKYNFRITAKNKGGESFATETLSACINPSATKTILIVNGFNRLSAPAVIDNDSQQGFDLTRDIGVQRGIYAGWNGPQTCFNKSTMGREGPGGLGYGSNEMAGKFVCGNEFNYASAHADAMTDSRYNIVSCSSKALEAGLVDPTKYDCIDLILGLEKDDGHSLVKYKTFSKAMQQQISKYTQGGGRLIVSGAFIGSDMTDDAEREWMASTLKTSYTCSDNNATASAVTFGVGTNFEIYRTPNAKHYAAQQVDVVSSLSPAYCAMQYADGTSAAVAYDGADYKCFTVGFPLECITSPTKMRQIMSGILNFVLK